MAVLEARLRQDDFLAVAAHLQDFFVAERFEFGADGALTAPTGQFTLRGAPAPLPANAGATCAEDFGAALTTAW